MPAQTDLAQLLYLPFSDFDALFGTHHADSVAAFFALKEDSEYDGGFMLELILWGVKDGQVLAAGPQDVVCPAPPFGSGGGNYNLLQHAN